MKNTNKKNSEHMSNKNQADPKEQFDDLWLELEPRLKKPKHNKWVLLLAFLIGLFSIGSLGWLAINNTKLSSSESAQIEIASSNKIETQLNQHSATTENEVVNNHVDEIQIENENTNNRTLLTQREQPIESKVLQGEEVNIFTPNKSANQTEVVTAERSVPTTINNNKKFNKTSKILVPLATHTETHIKNQDSSVNLSTSDSILKKNNVKYNKFTNEEPLAFLPNIELKLLNFKRAKIVNSDSSSFLNPTKKSKFSLVVRGILLFNANEEIVQTQNYYERIDNSLTLDKGYQFEIVPNYSITSNVNLGLGVSYTRLYETFRLNNVVQTELFATHPEAFYLSGNFIAADKCLPATISQDIQHNNHYVSLSLVPQIEYSINLNAFKIGFGAGLPIMLFQDYQGTLFDENSLRIYEGQLYEQKRFAQFGMQLNHSISFELTDRINLGYQLRYQKWSQWTDPISGYQQSAIRSIGMGAQLGFIF